MLRESPTQNGMVINIGAVLTALRKILSFEMTIAEWIGTAILAGIPYLVVGVIWSAHPHRPPQRASRHRPRGVASSDPS